MQESRLFSGWSQRPFLFLNELEMVAEVPGGPLQQRLQGHRPRFAVNAAALEVGGGEGAEDAGHRRALKRGHSESPLFCPSLRSVLEVRKTPPLHRSPRGIDPAATH